MWFLGEQSKGRIIFTDARIIDPETGKDINGNLIVENGRIKDFGPNVAYDVNLDGFYKVINCEGRILMPGVIDIHVHLRDPGQTHKEDIHSGTKSAAAGGVTTVVCQPNTTPPIDSIETFEYIKNKAEKEAFVNVKIYAAITKNGERLSDILSLHKAGAVGFTDDGLPVMNPLLMQKAFEYTAHLGVPVAQHAEDLNLSNKGCINQGAISNKLNVPGISDLSEYVMIGRDVMLLEKTHAHYHVLHISTKKSVEIVEKAKRLGMNITCEVTPHHLLLNENVADDYNTLAKMNPPLRTEEDRLYLIEALQNGTIDAIASDHAPHDEESKNLPLTKAAFGIVGLETILPLSLELYHNGSIDLYDLLRKLTCNPAKIINSDAGRIKLNAPADLIVLDIDHEYTIDVNQFASKSKNSPFNGRRVRGKVVCTVVGGNVVYQCSI